MPIFDYHCGCCQTDEKDVFVRSADEDVLCYVCLKSGCTLAPMTKLPAVPQMHIIPADGIHLKHVCPGGKTFHSKRDMKDYAKKHDLELGALL